MNDTGGCSLVRRIADSTPGMPIAVIGLSLSLYASESARMSSFQNVQPGGLHSAIPNIASIIALIALLLVYQVRPTFRLHRYPLVGFLVAGSIAASTLYHAGVALIPQAGELDFLARCIRRAGEVLLMLCWAEALIPLGSRKVAVVFTLSLFALGAENALSALLKEGAVYTMLALVPVLSTACLYWFKDRAQSIDYYRPDSRPGSCGAFEIDRSLMPSTTSRANLGSMALVFLLPLTCYSFVFGNVHFSWVPNQDGSVTSLSIQMAAALGTALAGLLLLSLITQFWGRRKLELYNLFMLPLLVLTLYLTDLLGGTLSFLYVVPLNIVQKLALFLMWIVPFLVPSKRSPLIIWGIALILYQGGKVLSTMASGIADTQFYTLAAIAFVMVLIAENILGIMLDHGRQEFAEENSESRNDSSPENAPTESLCTDIAREHRLTRREEEILGLLADGMTAAAIAETLVVSTSTAKSHMRNIYAKLDVHTQSELLLLIHRRSE